MNARKLIVMDLDGTLLNEEGIVTQKTKKYLGKLKKEGYVIAIATGRILKSALIATDGAEFANYIVADAGAAVYKMQADNWEEVDADLISRKIAEEIISEFDDEKFRHIDLCSKDYINMFATKYFSENKVVRIFDDKDTIVRNIHKITHISAGFWKNDFVKEYQKIFTKKYPELDIKIMQDSFDDVQWLELFNKGVEKYSGINKVAQMENIKNENIIAFGDGLNDIDMIEKCGIGVAMKNALIDVKEKANFITDKTNLEDGIIDFLQKYL